MVSRAGGDIDGDLMAELTLDDGPLHGIGNGNGDGPVRMPSRPSPPVPANGRPVRKDEIELVDRGLYIESWLPERRSRRKPLLFIHGELAGSWLWERYLAFFASRGWEGHALNLRNHYWSQTADPTTLSFGSYTDDVAGRPDADRSRDRARRPRHGRPAGHEGRRADAPERDGAAQPRLAARACGLRCDRSS